MACFPIFFFFSCLSALTAFPRFLNCPIKILYRIPFFLRSTFKTQGFQGVLTSFLANIVRVFSTSDRLLWDANWIVWGCVRLSVNELESVPVDDLELGVESGVDFIFGWVEFLFFDSLLGTFLDAIEEVAIFLGVLDSLVLVWFDAGKICFRGEWPTSAAFRCGFVEWEECTVFSRWF